MSLADQPAFPTRGFDPGYAGLTKREYAAIQIMAGLAGFNDEPSTPLEASKVAVAWADALLAALDKLVDAKEKP